MKVLAIILMLVLGSCIDTTLPDSFTHQPIYPPIQDIDYLACEYSHPYDHFPELCVTDDAYGNDCCTWEVDWHCHEKWCTWDDNCDWEFTSDGCE